MGQKTNPISNRIGITRGWDSNWCGGNYELQRVLDIADKALVMDCSELEYISSAGLRFFMRLKRETEAKGGKVRITNMNEDVAEIFRMSGFHNIFEISESET